MRPEKVFVVLNQRDYLLGVYTTEWDAKRQAAIFTKSNREHGDSSSAHRVVEYTESRQIITI